MRHHLTFFALSLMAALSACAVAQDKSPVQEPAAAEVANPMASFARMVGGEWRVTFSSGTSMFHTWHWGPGQHSMRRMTDGSGAGGEPWRELQVYYWHSGRKEVCLLSLHPDVPTVGRGVSEGTIKFEGEIADAVFDLYQTGGRRKMGLRWAFDGPDKYHETLLEATGPDGLKPMNEFDHVRSKTPPAKRPRTGEEAPKPTEHLKAFESLLGRIWDGRGNWGTGDAFHIESTFEFIPLANAFYARSFALRGNGEPIHLLDAYFYHHTGTDRLRCLALSNSGGVYEGDVAVLDGGSLQLDLKGYEGHRVVPYVVRLDFEKDGTKRHRVWSVDGAERTPLLDVHHTASEMSKGIWYVFQDTKDNYWFGSDGQGVYRFDGTTITHFTTKDGLCNDRIRGIQQHKSGDILITTLDGVSKYDGQRFVTLPVTVMDSPDKGWVLDPEDVWLPWQPKQNGPYRYDGKTLFHLKFPKHPREDEFYATHPTRPWSPYDVYCVYKDRKGNMWFGTANFGICRFDGTHLDWMYEDHLTQIEGGGMFGIRSIIEDKSGAFWFCNTQYRYNVQPNGAARQNNGQITYKTETGLDLSGTSPREKFFYFMSITEDNNQDLWMATYGGGVWRYDGKNLTHYPVKDGDKDVTLFSIYKDNRGDLWLGTHEAGAYKFNGKTFEKFRP